MIRTLGFVLTTLLLATSSNGGAGTDLPTSGIQTLSNSTPSTYQRTLSAFSGSTTSLTPQQKAQVKAAVDANPTAEKFICTGIRYYSQPTSINIMVRKRAKAACDYAKELNPNLSTWFQNKPTQARSYAGKVLLTLKMPSADTSPIPTPTPSPTPGQEPDWSSDPNLITTNAGMIDSEQCKLYSQDESNFSFINNPNKGVYPSSGVQRHFFAFIRFSDYEPQQTPKEWMSRFGSHAREYYSANSFGALDLRFEHNESWVNLGPSPSNLAWLRGSKSYETHLEAIRASLQALDSSTDFSIYDGVHIVFGTDPMVRNGGTAAFNSAPGNAIFFDGKRFASSSTYTDDIMRDWGLNAPRVVTHEMGHTFGLQDLYAYQHDPNNYETVHRFVGQVDLMGFISAFSPSMLNWNKWRLGWLENKNIYCLRELPDKPLMLSAATSKSNPSLIVLIRNDGSRIVLEYRAAGTDGLPDSLSGVFAYKVTTAGNGLGSIKLLRKSEGLSISSDDFARGGEELCVEDLCIRVRVSTAASAIVDIRSR